MFGKWPLFPEISFRLGFTPVLIHTRKLRADLNNLDEGINLINAGDQRQVALDYGDAIYNWDMQRWLKAAYSIESPLSDANLNDGGKNGKINGKK